MRQSQKSNRTRGRGRKAANPLSRSYDSNGPDVKIRGTASHIAEKYQSLARDAIASGDLVMAENYYQHAEHYLRIIAAAQPASREEGRPNNNDGNSNNGGNNGSRKAANVNGDDADDANTNNASDVEDTAVEMDVVAVAEVPGSGDQPDVAPPAEVVDEEVAAAGAPRRRRRTTYRSRKRPTAAERKAEGGDGSDGAKEKPAVVASED
ncbi:MULTISPECIES: DUF4167 domain-containing protein [Cohaesibacter]|uniref:DUF4167 domain-containing protein n=1 Tax=Cohaesibacter TaxID=655352 RepID=UPI000DE9FF6E|nr:MULTISPECIES: DUF4167 domain-containing protein [Cohaesibacter]TLP42614.1 DUF4167 domain-containing protein [Cohaesibacter sp. CAU 1516]